LSLKQQHEEKLSRDVVSHAVHDRKVLFSNAIGFFRSERVLAVVLGFQSR
jgi:hypothetical protein